MRPTTLDVVSATVLKKTPAPPAPDQALALHKSALQWIEMGSRGSAEQVLVGLTRSYPDYVPGILERALAYARRGDQTNAAKWMAEVMKRVEGMPDDQVVVGPEELPVAFYRETARTFLERPREDAP
jgi:hypothetical protein